MPTEEQIIQIKQIQQLMIGERAKEVSFYHIVIKLKLNKSKDNVAYFFHGSRDYK